METSVSRLAAAAVAGIAASWFCRTWIFIVLTLAAVLLDYITGLLAGRANEGLDSKRATRGLYKKIGIFMLLGLGLFLDEAVNYFMANGADFFTLPFSLPIAHIVTIWIVITEAISVCENLERLGVPIPKWIVKMLKRAGSKIDNEDTKEEGAAV